LAAARGLGQDERHLKFMYRPPPGVSDKTGEQQEAESSKVHVAGDDAAAAEFRRMFMKDTNSVPSNSQNVKLDSSESNEPKLSSLPSHLIPSSNEINTGLGTDHRTALEKAVGRKGTASNMTLAEQLERFPQLAGAPMVKGMSADNVHVSFKPLGQQIRNVRCMKCGEWGHAKGERECKFSFNPFEASLNVSKTGDGAPLITMKDPSSNPPTTKREYEEPKALDQRSRTMEFSSAGTVKRNIRRTTSNDDDDESSDEYHRHRRHRSSRKEHKSSTGRKHHKKSSKKRSKHSRHHRYRSRSYSSSPDSREERRRKKHHQKHSLRSSR